jgi:hypothetical protein
VSLLVSRGMAARPFPQELRGRDALETAGETPALQKELSFWQPRGLKQERQIWGTRVSPAT